MEYEKNMTYYLKVTGTLTVNDSQYYLVEDNQMKFRVRMLPFQYSQPNPETIKCTVYNFDADGSPLFVQYKPDIAKQLYTIGDTYPFIVGKKQNSPTVHRNSYYGYDSNGLQAIITAGSNNALLAGRTVNCVLKHIDSEGLLTVELNDRETEQETNFLTFQQLMHNLKLEPPLECLTLVSLKQEPVKSKKLVQMLEEYESHIGAWIFSYLFILQSKMEEIIDVNELEKLCTLVRYQRAIIEWMLEDSLFLTFYSPDTVSSLRTKGEHELLRGEALIKAVELIENNEADTFLEKTFAKMRISGYLLDRSRKIALVTALFRIDNTLWDKNLTTLAEFCYYLSTDTTATDEYPLLSVIALIRKHIDKKDWNENGYDRKIQLLALYLLLCKDRENTQFAVYKAMLYRYCCLASPELPSCTLIDKAFNELATDRNINKLEFGWNDVLQFKTTYFVTKLRVFISDDTGNEQQAVAQLTTPNGRILLQNNLFTIYVGSSFNKLMDYQKPVELFSLLDGRIRVMGEKEQKPKAAEKGNIAPLKRIWEELAGTFRKKAKEKQKEIITKSLPTAGTQVTIKLSPLKPRFPLMLFAEIIDPYYEGKGVIIVSEVCRYHINKFDDIFYEGDTFDATVVNVDEHGKMSFSIFQELFDMVASTTRPGTRVYAKLNKISKGSCIWVCEKGYSLFTPAVTPYPEVGETALLEVTNINEKGYINASIVELADVPIDEERALAGLISEYINYCHPDDEEDEEDDLALMPDGESTKTEKQLTLPFLRELSELLIISSTSGISVTDRYNTLGSALLTSCFTGDETYKEYISLLMNYEENIYNFATHIDQAHWTDTLRIDDEAVSRFPSLSSLRERIEILKQYCSHTFDPHLAVGIATTKNQNKEHIIRLVLANGLLYHTLEPDELLSVRNELLKRIGAPEFIVPFRIEKKEDKTEEEEVVNLGRESGEIEFKSSIVYPANRTTPDMKQQSEVILRTLAGFLNADGGTLYIGVADNGNVTGLKNDFSYMACDSDAYERFIRQRIISTMGKDVNSLIHIAFPKYGEREICHVTVPCYGKLIELNGAVWQRQGNSTILLDGNALLKQQQRKKASLKNEPEKEQEKPQEKKTSRKKNEIPTSSLRPNPLTENELEEGKDIYAYLVLLENGGYMLSDEMVYSDFSLLTLAIGEHEVEGNLLLCYDNAYVNRIPLKMLLKKKRRYAYKNGVYKDARLTFATIENGEPYILCCTNKQGTDYLKLFTMSKIKQNVDLTLKGTPLFTYDFGEVTRWEVIPQPEAEKLRKLICDKTQYQGTAVRAETIATERELLRKLNLTT
ncbi:RNA-binding domain-containing protein [Bacteroides sp. GM023]|uniref:RNA-binding domain-containing protein n=1 Tax=Bacteroides sp. GM023 TaxID=2723058 RepID=UPI00168B9D58|nr:RNA-binding domain-containing protein [Bacteroides sp. GM023]MBD3588093.1 ATP-binding protein [Bacteroides sp. GM023]